MCQHCLAANAQAVAIAYSMPCRRGAASSLSRLDTAAAAPNGPCTWTETIRSSSSCFSSKAAPGASGAGAGEDAVYRDVRDRVGGRAVRTIIAVLLQLLAALVGESARATAAPTA